MYIESFLKREEASYWYDKLYQELFKGKVCGEDDGLPIQCHDMYKKVFPQLYDKILGKLRDEYKITLEVFSTNILYYRDGRDTMMKHSHPGQLMFILSLGETRTLLVGGFKDEDPEKEYKLKCGDAFLSGPLFHSIVEEPHVKGGRICIVFFFFRNGKKFTKEEEEIYNRDCNKMII